MLIVEKLKLHENSIAANVWKIAFLCKQKDCIGVQRLHIQQEHSSNKLIRKQKPLKLQQSIINYYQLIDFQSDGPLM